MIKKMRMRSVLLIAAILVIACTAFAGCNPQAVYDDDSLIAKNSTTSVKRSEVSNSSRGYYETTVEYFMGAEKIASIEVARGRVITVDLQIYGGRFKLVLVKGDTVAVVVDQSFSGDIPLNVEDGTYDLKIVGDGAHVKFNIKY